VGLVIFREIGDEEDDGLLKELNIKMSGGGGSVILNKMAGATNLIGFDNITSTVKVEPTTTTTNLLNDLNSLFSSTVSTGGATNNNNLIDMTQVNLSINQ
jgi:hypothetical protein